jgi:hypothetical protein
VAESVIDPFPGSDSVEFSGLLEYPGATDGCVDGCVTDGCVTDGDDGTTGADGTTGTTMILVWERLGAGA